MTNNHRLEIDPEIVSLARALLAERLTGRA